MKRGRCDCVALFGCVATVAMYVLLLVIVTDVDSDRGILHDDSLCDFDCIVPSVKWMTT